MGLHIFLTGEPKSGKSTILREALEVITNKSGFLTSEMSRDGRRYGFKAISDTGAEVVLATDSKETSHPVGRFFAQISEFDLFISNLAKPKIDDLIYIDEIGQMQLLSKKFIETITDYLDMPNVLIGTVSKVYDHPFIQKIKMSPETVFIEITLENREDVKKMMKAVTANYQLLFQLDEEQRRKFIGLVEDSSYNITRIYKLFHNTLPYVINKRVRKIDDSHFEINGQTRSHIVTIDDLSEYACDCDLYKGKGKYKNNRDTCSHIFAALLA